LFFFQQGLSLCCFFFNRVPLAGYLCCFSFSLTDLLKTDLLKPDLLQPDLLQPDLLKPDLLKPDLLQPDLDDCPFIVLTETKPSKRHIPVWALYSPLLTRVEAHANTLSP